MRYEVDVKFNRDFVSVDEKNMHIEIGIRSKPIKGKANEEIVKKLAKHFSVPSSNVSIIAGARSKRKIVEISD